MNLKNKIFFLFCWSVTHLITAQESITLLTQEKQFVAGSNVILAFKANATKDLKINVQNI